MIEVVPLASLNGAYGAFSRDTNTIYLASEYINSATPSAIADVLLEEYGHYIDAWLNSVETVGDEGEIFADLVQGNAIDPAVFTEDDTATVTIDGQTITIEQGFPIIYVRQGATGSNNGTSWANAYSSLAAALTNAPTGSEIWVAAGTYTPNTQTDRTLSFQLKNLVEIYGGFAGTETNRNQRNINANQTILSGDIGIFGDESDNSYTVVTGTNLSSATVFDGFTITKGNEARSSANGGGIELTNSSPILSNLIITDNTANNLGGGIYILGGNPQLINITFTNNSASNYGGGLDLDSNSNAILSNLNFVGNTAGYGGGAIALYRNSSTITNTSFVNNSTTNSGSNGGAIYINEGSPRLTNVSFTGNSTNSMGGGIFSGGIGQPIIINAIFERNSSASGGGFYSISTGGVSGNPGSRPILTNVTFSNNTATNRGGAIVSDSISSVSVFNSILWGNQGASPDSQIYNTNGGITVVSDSIVQGGYPLNENIIDANPLFVNASSGDLRLQGLSPAINTGSNDAVTGITTDVAGGSRIVDGTVDLGAYEFDIDPAQYVASHPDLFTGIGYNPDALRQHYINYGRFEGRSADSFDEYRYIASNPDLIGAYSLNGAGATAHYILSGYNEGRSLTSFSPSRYINSYEGLFDTYGTNTLAATQHYITNGFTEGRNPNLFQSDRYIASYPDLIRGYGYNLEGGSDHYLSTGRGEGRQVLFNPQAYLDRYPELKAGYGDDLTGATAHYILYGFNEGRTWM